jgi:hypothetical protein
MTYVSATQRFRNEKVALLHSIVVGWMLGGLETRVLHFCPNS